MRNIFLLLISIMVYSCNNIDLELQEKATEVSDSIFTLKQIDSKAVLLQIEAISEKELPDTTNYRRKDTKIFVNSAAGTYFRVGTYKDGVIRFISFYKNGKEINVAEYYQNGIIKCKFNVSPEGVRDGRYECYHENGNLRKIGQYQSNKEVGEEIGYDSIGHITYRFMW